MDSPAETADKPLCVSPLTSGGGRALLRTADGVTIEAEHLPAAGISAAPEAGGSGQSADLAIVIAHGFTGALDRPAVRRAATHLSRFGGVITFSFRGHGRSGGRSTVGDLEVLDLDAAVRWARGLGYGRVATVGFSMGGSVVLRHAGMAAAALRVRVPAGGQTVVALVPESTGGRSPAQRPEAGEAPPAPSGARGALKGTELRHAGGEYVEVDAVVAVSSPARWYYRGTAPMRRLHWVVTRPVGRLVSRVGLKTRIHPLGWDPVPLSPVEAVPHIAPTPLLIVHGDRDGYFPLDHPLSLAAAAGEGGAELWIERGFGHAEDAADAALLDRIGHWLTDRVSGIPGNGGGRAMMDDGMTQ